MSNKVPIAMEYTGDGMMVDSKVAADADYAANFEVPKADMMGKIEGFGNTPLPINSSSSDGIFGDAFSGDKIGSTMQGIGAVASAAAGVYDTYNKKKYQDKVFGMEEARVSRETDRQDRQQASYDRVFG